jgi:copper chaperone CopZ
VEKALKRLNGVEDASVHFATGRIEIRFDPARIGVGDLLKAIRATGYQAGVSTLG